MNVTKYDINLMNVNNADAILMHIGDDAIGKD